MRHAPLQPTRRFLDVVPDATRRRFARATLVRRLALLELRARIGCGAQGVARRVRHDLPPDVRRGFEVLHPSVPIAAPDALAGRERVALADALTRIWFAGLRAPEGIFVDLRLATVRKSDNAERTVWAPGGSWYTLADGFRRSLIALYADRFDHVARSAHVGETRPTLLVSEPTGVDRERSRAFCDHLVDLEPGRATARLALAFEALGRSATSTDRALRPDLAVVAVALSTLAESLDRLGVAPDAAGAFRRVFP